MPFIEESHPDNRPSITQSFEDGYAEGEWVTLRKVETEIERLLQHGHFGGANTHKLFAELLSRNLGIKGPSLTSMA